MFIVSKFWTNSKTIQTKKDEIFEELQGLVLSYGYFTDDAGSTHPDKYSSEEVQARWDKFYDLVDKYRKLKAK